MSKEQGFNIVNQRVMTTTPSAPSVSDAEVFQSRAPPPSYEESQKHFYPVQQQQQPQTSSYNYGYMQNPMGYQAPNVYYGSPQPAPQYMPQPISQYGLQTMPQYGVQPFTQYGPQSFPQYVSPPVLPQYGSLPTTQNYGSPQHNNNSTNVTPSRTSNSKVIKISKTIRIISFFKNKFFKKSKVVQFDSGARFRGKGAGSLTIPPPPPGYSPTPAQIAAMQGQPVVVQKKKKSFF